MSFPRILYGYLAREVLLYGLIGFGVMTALFTAQNLIARVDSLLASGIASGDIGRLTAWIVPMLAGYMVPVGLLFGVLVAMARLSADSEIVAMRACGLGLRQILAPVVAVSVPLAVLTGLLTIHFEPLARREVHALLREVAARGGFLKPGEFRAIGSRVLFVESRERNGDLRRVVIADRDDPARPFLIVAGSGRFFFDPDNETVRLDLYDGDIHFEPDVMNETGYRRIAFDRFEYPVDASQFFDEAGRVRPRGMTLSELYDVMERIDAGESIRDLRDPNPRAYPMQVHRRFALACTPVLFALVGTPLGLRRVRGARSFGALVCVVLVFAYYALLSFSEDLGRAGSVPPVASVWLPNLAFGVAAIPLILRNLRGQI